jgi:hypothetical protein
MVEKLLAVLVLLACIGALLAMVVGPQRIARVRRWARGLADARTRRAAARREAEQAIDRARRKVEREGNVIRPHSFDRRPPDQDAS